jgi:hypothetical protein
MQGSGHEDVDEEVSWWLVHGSQNRDTQVISRGSIGRNPGSRNYPCGTSFRKPYGAASHESDGID